MANIYIHVIVIVFVCACVSRSSNTTTKCYDTQYVEYTYYICITYSK